VIVVGLTGGIGAGKSTVSTLLAQRGAVVIDADAITKALQRPGEPVFAAIVKRFGSGVVDPGGSLDRAALAAIVFSDPAALKDLNAIVHPAVGVEILRLLEAERAGDRVVVLDIPLLVESSRYPIAGLVVVDVDPAIAVERLVGQRGMTESDARARMANQVGREERRAKADRVIDNSGDRESLERQVDEVWAWMQSLPPAPAA
jgi:dephospho-CoA kinase